MFIETTESSHAFLSHSRLFSFVNDGMGLPVFWCNSGLSTLYKVRNESSFYCRDASLQKYSWKRLKIFTYTKVAKTKKISPVYHCVIKQSTEYYYTNLLGDKFIRTQRKIITPSRQECSQMVDSRKCAYGQLTEQKDGSWSTTNEHIVNFPGNIEGIWKGELNNEVYNCFFQSIDNYIIAR